jgi:peptidoglycan/xylan/chitin deacetylase (PgdA/CDA1 family)
MTGQTEWKQFNRLLRDECNLLRTMTGVVTLSIELELGWGMHDRAKYDHLSSGRTAETQALYRLLDLADNYDIPITFGIVGHLLHDSCTGYHSGPHSSGWWSEDPGSNSDRDPLFYAPDLVSEIQDRRVNHELATHTYSHLLANEASADHLDDELSKVAETYSEFGLPSPVSIVMPRHQRPDYSVLADHGIETIRRPIEGYSQSFTNPVSKVWWLLTRDHPQSTIETRDELRETTVTPHPSLTSITLPAGQSAPHPVFSVIPRRIRQSLHRRYLVNAIDRAATEGSHVHLWTHIYNMANNDQWPLIKDELSHLAKRRNEGHILIKRMDELNTQASA